MLSLFKTLHNRGAWGFVGMLGLVVLIEFAISGRAMHLYDCDEWAYRWSARKAAKWVKPFEILCFGDSLIKLSVIPKIIEEQTGKPTFNLAVSGSQAPASYFLLKRVIDSGARPAAVVVGFNPPLMRVGPRHNMTRWPVFLNPVETAELAIWANDPLLVGEIALSQVIPSLRGKSTIRAKVAEALGGTAAPYFTWNSMGLRNWKTNKGAQLMTGSQAVQGLTEPDLTKLQVGFYPFWSVHPANIAGIDHFFELAARHQIPVYWVLPPLLPALHDHLAAAGIDAAHEQFIRSWQQKYPNVVVLDGRRKALDLNAFWDPQHLSVEGASAFSLALGTALRQASARTSSVPAHDRWVAVPEFHLGPAVPGVENIDQSQAVVLEGFKVRR